MCLGWSALMWDHENKRGRGRQTALPMPIRVSCRVCHGCLDEPVRIYSTCFPLNDVVYFCCMAIAHFFGIKLPILFVYYDTPYYAYQDKIVAVAVVAYICLVCLRCAFVLGRVQSREDG